MKKYKVIALSVGGASNKVFRSGDVVTEADFPPGHVAALIKGKFLKELECTPEARISEIESHGVSTPDVELPDLDGEQDKVDETPETEPEQNELNYNDMTKAQLASLLLEHGVVVPDKAKKEELIQRLNELNQADTEGHQADNE